MPGRKQNVRRVTKRKAWSRKKGTQGKQSAIVPAKAETPPMALPRPRIRFRNALRAVGLDEWQIAWILRGKVEQLKESKSSSDNKLLLDYMKEAIRHLDPASAAAAANAASPDAPTVELVHHVGRPDRESA